MALSSDSAFVQVNVKYKVEGLNKAANESKKAAKGMLDFSRVLKQVSASLVAYKLVSKLGQEMSRLGSMMLTSNEEFEKFEKQLKIFSGSGKVAKDLMGFLTEASTRLAGGLQDLLGGATALQTFGIDVKENLELVSDVAVATNRSVEDVAVAFGRIVAGDPRTKQFLVTRRGDMEAFNAALERGESRLEAAKAAFARFSGVSAELRGTMVRLKEEFTDTLYVAAKIVGEPTFELLRSQLQEIVTSIRSLVFEDQTTGKLKEDGLLSKLGTGLKATVQVVVDLKNAFELLYNAINAISGIGSKRGGLHLQKIGDALAPSIRDAFPDPDTVDYGPFTLQKYADKQYRRLVFSIFGMDEEGMTNNERYRAIKEASDKYKQEQRDILLTRKYVESEFAKKRRERQEKITELINQAGRNFALSQYGLNLGPDLDARAIRLKLLEQLKPPEDEEIPMRPEWEPEVIAAGLKKELELHDRRVDFAAQFKDKQKEYLEEVYQAALEKERELAQARYEIAENLSDRAVNDLGYIFFGGRNANSAIDKQVEALQREIDVMNGVTTPLTRQEELMNRIVELESQRVTLNERIGNIIRRTLGDLATAVAKAAILRAFGFGTPQRGQSGGFMSLLKTGLSLIPHPAAQVASVGLRGFDAAGGFGSGGGPGIAISPSDDPFGLGGGGGIDVGGGIGFRPKPVVVNNPIFLSNDVRGVAETFADEASKRMR